MAGPQKRDRAVTSLVADAEKAFQGGDPETGGRLVGEAANLLVAQGELEEAINLCVSLRDFARAGAIAEQASDLKRAGQLYFRAGDFLRSARARERNGEPMMAAELYERAGAYDKAAAIYEAQHDFVRGAQLLERAGERKHAADLLVRALTGDGSHRLHGAEAAEACRRAAVLYAEVGHVELAVRVLSWGGQTVFAGRLLADAGRTEEAIETLVRGGDYLAAAQVARDAGDEARAQGLLGERAEREGRLAEAASHFEECDQFERAARLYEILGNFRAAALSHERGGHLDLAAALWERLGEPDEAVRCYRAAGREAEAKALLERSNSADDSIRRYVKDGELLRAAAAVLSIARSGDRERYGEAINYLEQIPPGHPDHYAAVTMLAEVLAENGEGKRALAILQRMFMGARPQAEHVPAMYQYGRLLELEGFLAGARNAYRTAAAFDPHYRDLVERLEQLKETDGRPTLTSDLDLPPVPPQAVPSPSPRPVPTLPMVVGGPAAGALPLEVSRRVPLKRANSATMDLFDQELQALTDDIGVESFLTPSAPMPIAKDPAPSGSEGPAPSGELIIDALEEVKDDEVTRADALLGVVLRGRFRIERRLGRGAQALVYLARDQVLDREVAIKVLNDSVAADPQALERFLREARLAARVHHSSCIAIYDFGQEGGLTFMAMEYFRGRTLRDLAKKGPMEPYLALRIAKDVASALGAVHESGIVHRDVKPTNVMVDRGGNVRITDFGVARAMGDESQTGMMVGTMKYMAPEQARGKDADRRADIFSLGVVIYELLAGEAPFGGDLDALIARVTKPPPELPEALVLPKVVRDLVKKCMQRKPSGRYPSVEPLIEDLDQALLQLKAARKNAKGRGNSLASGPSRPAAAPADEDTTQGGRELLPR